MKWPFKTKYMRLIISSLIFLSLSAFSQDTIRLMHYNLLMYGNNFGGCNSSNNNVNDKNEYLKTIIDYIQPDIVAVCELDNSSYYHDLILNEVFNINGTDHFKRANVPNLSYGYTVNQVFYNSNLFTLESNSAVETDVRDIDIFRFTYNNSNNPEPIELSCIAAHLKAGNSGSDEQERAEETTALMNYLNNTSAEGNYIFSGDFNFYTAAEQGYTNLLVHPNQDIRFYDPIDSPGEWNNNPAFADIHTQSTHTNGDCPSTGGMDDRFDFILVSDEIKEGTDKISFIEDSYWAVGQDGLHFNKSLYDSPQIDTVPSYVLSALYGMSDHLPVILDLVIDNNVGGLNTPPSQVDFTYTNPVSDKLDISIRKSDIDNLTFAVYSLEGKQLSSIDLKNISQNKTISIPIQELNQGMYFLHVLDGKKKITSAKFVKL
jgi:endonuclease/exonuclease/phosphatase family metal-dependent hydrolase